MSSLELAITPFVQARTRRMAATENNQPTCTAEGWNSHLDCGRSTTVEDRRRGPSFFACAFRPEESRCANAQVHPAVARDAPQSRERSSESLRTTPNLEQSRRRLESVTQRDQRKLRWTESEQWSFLRCVRLHTVPQVRCGLRTCLHQTTRRRSVRRTDRQNPLCTRARPANGQLHRCIEPRTNRSPLAPACRPGGK